MITSDDRNHLRLIEGSHIQNDIHATLPDVINYKNILYVPKHAGALDPRSGFYERTGRRIASFDLAHQYPTIEKVSYVPFVNNLSDFVKYEGSVIYGGNLESHFGHFITECLNTLWYAATFRFDQRPVLFHSTLLKEDLLKIDWLRTFLDACGIEPSRIMTCKHPTAFSEITMPGQAFCEDTYVFEGFLNFTEKLGDCLALESFENSIVYVSREGLDRGSMKMSNEPELIAALKKRDVRIVAPALTGLREQIGLFRGGNVVVGPIGSSFHTSIFSKNPQGIAFSPEPKVARSFRLLDFAHDSAIDYYHVNCVDSDLDKDLRFQINYSLVDPDATASELVEQANIKINSGRLKFTKNYPNMADTIEFFSILTLGEGELCVDQHGLVCSRQPGPSDLRAGRLYGIILGKILLLIQGADDLPAFSFREEDTASSVWPFFLKIDHSSDVFTLMNPDTGAYLSAPPPEVGNAAHIRARDPDAWEKFRFRLRPDFTYQDRVKLLVRLKALIECSSNSSVWVRSALDALG